MASSKAALVAIFILAILAQRSVYAADTCEGVFRLSRPIVDFNYGRASQLDPFLEAQGLIHPGGSQLCGPTCLFNGLAKFHRLDGRNVDSEGPERIAGFVRRLFPLTGFDVVSMGARAQDMVHAMAAALREEKIEADVRLYSSLDSSKKFTNLIVGRPTLELMHQSIFDDTIIIARIGRYGVTDPTEARVRQRQGGHFVIVAGYNSEIPSQIYVVDPMSPRQLRVVDLIQTRPVHFQSPTYQARFTQSPDPNFVRLIEELIVVKRRKTTH